MATKRKKSPVIEEPKPEEQRVSQVVEVVEETDTQEAVATIKKDAVEIENLVENLEKENTTEQEVIPSDDHADMKGDYEGEREKKEEEQKEVVEEIFHRDTSQVPLEITTASGTSRKLVLWIVIVIGVAVLAGGGLIAVSRGGISLPFITAPTPTPTPVPTPTPTPNVTVKREDLSIKVLNGGGVPGAAGKMKSFLEEKGYTVSGVGNTEDYTYEQTEILVKSDKEAYRKLLQEDLNDDYVIGTGAATLSDDASEDAQVIVGKE